MSGYEFQAQTAEQLTRNFGVLFISDLAKLGPVVGQWYGPIRSSFGWHYLWISAIEQGVSVTSQHHPHEPVRHHRDDVEVNRYSGEHVRVEAV